MFQRRKYLKPKKTKEEHEAKKKEWFRNNKEKTKASSKRYLIANTGELKEKKKLWYKENKEKIKAQAKAYYEKNKEKVRAKVYRKFLTKKLQLDYNRKTKRPVNLELLTKYKKVLGLE